MRKPDAPPNLRNGLKWRDGRPRWEPSPKNRAAGIKGLDLRREDGRWMDRGEAISAADARQLWARYIREAEGEGAIGEEARAELRDALQDLDDAGTQPFVADLVAMARKLVRQAEGKAPATGGFAPRTVRAMVAAYFAALEAEAPYFCGEGGELKISKATRENYRGASRVLIARFGDRRVDELTRGDMRAWYDELVREKSVSLANQRLSCSGAFFKWATLQQPPWLRESPCLRLGRSKAPGRTVFWEPEEEAAFVAWCDANGYVDIADAAVFGIWTGARIIDLCRANLEELKGDTWRFKPHKTARRSGREALAGIAPQLRVRIDRRWREAAAAKVTQAGGRPFLVDPTTGRRHTTRTLGDRTREAKAAAVLANAAPASILDKTGQDWRDTCITRLWEADVGLDRIPAWTGHSPDEAKTILRDHYLALRDSQARESLSRLVAYMERQGVGV